MVSSKSRLQLYPLANAKCKELSCHGAEVAFLNWKILKAIVMGESLLKFIQERKGRPK